MTFLIHVQFILINTYMNKTHTPTSHLTFHYYIDSLVMTFIIHMYFILITHIFNWLLSYSKYMRVLDEFYDKHHPEFVQLRTTVSLNYIFCVTVKFVM